MKLNRKLNFRKKSDLALLLLIPLFLCCCFLLYVGSLNNQNRGNTSSNIVSNEISNSETTSSVLSYKEAFEKTYKVIRVIDGDTLEIEGIGKVRLMGTDSPELSNPKQCFAEEATQKLRDLVLNQSLEIEYDSSQGNTDKYDRALLYLFNEAGVNINLEMVKSGYSYEYTYNKPYKYQTEFKTAQSNAKLNKIGLWAENTCNGSTEIPGEDEVIIGPVIPLVQPTKPEAIIQVPINNYTCNCSKTCANLSCEEAQFQLNSCGCLVRDGDKDGYACDSQCQ